MRRAQSGVFKRVRPMMKRAVVVGTALELLVWIQFWFAYCDGFLTVKEMQSIGINQGLPIVWHLAMWSDAVVISPLLTLLIVKYSERWTTAEVCLCALFGAITAYFMALIYTASPISEAHMHGHQLTVAGWIHIVYMGLAITVFTLFYFSAIRPNQMLLLATSAILTIHVFIGTHMALAALGYLIDTTWYPARPERSVLGWATIGVVSVGVWGRTVYLRVTYPSPTRL